MEQLQSKIKGKYVVVELSSFLYCLHEVLVI